MRISDAPPGRRRKDFRFVKRRNRLVERHLFLVVPVARRVQRSLPRWIEFDELLADGALGLLHAAIRFDRTRGVPFARFAARYVRGAMIDAARRRRRAPLPLPKCDAIGVDMRFAQAADRLDARAMLDRLPDDRRRRVVAMYFLDQLTMKQVARKLGVSEPRISQLIRRNLDTLRAAA